MNQNMEIQGRVQASRPLVLSVRKTIGSRASRAEQMCLVPFKRVM